MILNKNELEALILNKEAYYLARKTFTKRLPWQILLLFYKL